MEMRTSVIVTMALIFVFIAVSATTASAIPCNCGDICVNETGWWRADVAFNASGTPIQAAIDDATDGDSIYVYNGSYTENVNVNKRLTLQGEGRDVVTVTAQSAVDHVFEVTEDYVNISGFTATGATGSDKAGIYLGSNIDHCNISDNNAYNNFYGILLSSSSNNTLTNNTANSNSKRGICMLSSSNNTLADNTMSSNKEHGIYLGSSSNNNTLTSNTANSNTFHGIYLQFSSNNNLSGNNAYNNSHHGIYLRSSSNNNLSGNNAYDNSRYGIYLYSSSNNNTLTSNTANNNQQHGLYITSDSTGNTINSNTFCSNNQSGGAYYAIFDADANAYSGNTYNTTNGSTASCDHSCSAPAQTCGCDNGTYNYTCGETITESCIMNCDLNSNGTCFMVGANNIVIDGNGFSITGDGSTFPDIDYGIHVIGKTNVSIKNFNIYTFVIGIYLLDSSNNTLTSNTLTSNTASEDIGIYLKNSSNNTVTSNTANDNNYGIFLYSYSDYNTLINNTANNNGDNSGITLQYSDYNTLINNTANNNTYYGIYLWYSSNNTLTSNTAKYNTHHGIYLYSSSSSWSVSNNNALINNTANNNYGQGIFLTYYANNNTVTNNTANNNALNGIRIVRSDYNTLTSNTANYNTYGIYIYGVSYDPSSNNILNNNVITNNTNDGIYINLYSSNTEINNNYVCFNAPSADIVNAGIGTTGDDNTCNTTCNYNDTIQGATPCTNPCTVAPPAPTCGCDNGTYNYTCGETVYESCVMNCGLTSNGTCFTIGADDITIDGAGYSITGNTTGTGIYANGRNNITLKNFNIYDFSYGLYLDNSNNSKITNNTAFLNNDKSIAILNSHYNTIANNTAYNTTCTGIREAPGIYLSYSTNNNIRNNTAYNNSHYGLYIVHSDNNTIKDNTAYENSKGIRLMTDSNNNSIISNKLYDNTGEGIELRSSSNNTIKNNTINSNGLSGIYMVDSSKNNKIINNTVNDNQRHGLHISSSAIGNTINSNTFCSNNQTGGIYKDIYDEDSNSGGNNTCDTTHNWNDNGTTGCTFSCSAPPGDICVNTSGWWHVGGDFNASNTPIQHAIDNATAGGSIYVYNGSYTENIDVGTAHLTLEGEGRDVVTVTVAVASDHVFEVTANADYVNISGFTVQNATESGKAGIYLGDGVEHCNISSNNVTNNTHGIHLRSSSNNSLSGNNAYNNSYGGIYLYSSSNNNLSGNYAYNNPFHGIYLHSSSNNNNLSGNNAYNNSNHGIHLYYSSNNNNLSGNNAYNNSLYGIYLHSSSNNNNLSGNYVYNNSYLGIRLFSSSNNNLSGNYAYNNSKYGIDLHSSSSNNLSGNYAYNNSDHGIYMYSSSNNNLTSNIISGNKYNFGISGSSLSNYIQNIDTSNTVDGKPIYYWINQQDQQVPNDAGFVGIVNSTNITVRDLMLAKNREGVLFAYTNNSRIENVTASHNDIGIYLRFSSNNNLSGNYAYNNSEYGIRLFSSSNNNLSGNTAYNNSDGICLFSSSNNSLSGNNAYNNSHNGIYLYSSSNNNNLSGNSAYNNSRYGIHLYSSSNYNTLTNNTANSNEEGIYLYRSSYNTVDNNTVNDNDCIGITIDASAACFLGGTKILLADSSYKNIEDVEVGDFVQSYDEAKKEMVTGKVLKTFYHEKTDYYLVINGKLRLTPNHPMYVSNEWKEAGDIKIGDLLLDKDGNYVPVTSIEKIDDCVPVYNLEISGYHNYFAADILTHNKCPQIFSYNGTGYQFDVLINVLAVGPEEDRLFDYPLKYLKEPRIRVEYDSTEINYIDFIKLIIEDTTGQEGLQNKTYLLDPISCSGTDFDCNISLLAERDGQYLISDVNHKKFFLEFEDFPELEPESGYNRTIKIFSSGYQILLDDANFSCECKQVEGLNEFLNEYFSERNSNSYDNRYGYGNRNSCNTISNNEVSGNGFGTCGKSPGWLWDLNPCGISFIYEDNSSITNNTVTENYMGIRLNYSDDNTLTNNNASNNTNYDFYSDQNSPSNTIKDLTISSYPTTISFTYDNGIGIKGVTTPEPDPAGKVNISKFVDATNVTANSWLFLNVSYSDADVIGVDEASLKMYRHNGTGWELADDSGINGVNIVENYVYANITGFSVFAPLGNVTAAPSPCYIATATYGTPLDSNIDVLRDFRDDVLMTNSVGETFVSTYYATSPPIADALRANDGLRTVTRLTLITPLVYLSKFALNGIWVVFILIPGLAVVLSIRRDRMNILKSLLVGAVSILAFIAAIFSLGFVGYAIPFCAVIGAYMLPFVIPLSVVFAMCTVLKMHVNTKKTIKMHTQNSKM